jgi:hypothetical protein
MTPERKKRIQHTAEAVINEIYIGFILNKEVWFDDEAKKVFDRSLNSDVEQIKGKSKVMTDEFSKWTLRNGFIGNVEKVFWTAKTRITWEGSWCSTRFIKEPYKPLKDRQQSFPKFLFNLLIIVLLLVFFY